MDLAILTILGGGPVAMKISPNCPGVTAAPRRAVRMRWNEQCRYQTRDSRLLLF
jgi:hypothetical protein